MSVKCEREMKWNRCGVVGVCESRSRVVVCRRECESVTGQQCRMKDCGKKVCWVASVRVSDII